jgi:hypothetical protein
MSVYGTDVYGTGTYAGPGSIITGTGAFGPAAASFSGTGRLPGSGVGAFAAVKPTFAGTGKMPVRGVGNFAAQKCSFAAGLGWGLGQWGTSTWGEGVDPYFNPTIFLDATGYLRVSFTRTGVYAATKRATGSLTVLRTTGSRKVYAATGAIEDGD